MNINSDLELGYNHFLGGFVFLTPHTHSEALVSHRRCHAVISTFGHAHYSVLELIQKTTYHYPRRMSMAEMLPAALEEYMSFLRINYLVPEILPGGRWKAILPLLFTHAIVYGTLGDMTGMDDRWCYESLGGAIEAFFNWDGTGEPEGWHRHPVTGRRRPEGNPDLEYVSP
jgi:hypothetical protein